MPMHMRSGWGTSEWSILLLLSHILKQEDLLIESEWPHVLPVFILTSDQNLRSGACGGVVIEYRFGWLGNCWHDATPRSENGERRK